MNILIASHRRSGTHLTIDTIINNSKDDLELINFDKIRLEIPLVLEDNVVYKTHCQGNKFADDYQELRFDKIIYVYRDGRDVMKSLYKYEKENCDIYEFLNKRNKYEADEYEDKLSKIECWGYHMNSWINRDIYHLRFGDMIDNYDNVLKNLFEYLEIDRVKYAYDIRQSSRLKYYLDKYILRKNITTVKFRGGKKGGYQQLFDDKSLQLYKDILEKYNLKDVLEGA